MLNRLFLWSDVQYERESGVPNVSTLRSAMRLYLLVLLASAAVIVGLTGSLDITFLRLMAAIFIFAGFTLARRC